MPGGFTTTQITSMRNQNLKLTNQIRAQYGVKRALVYNSDLNATAQKHAEYMASRRIMQHSSEGQSFYYGKYQSRFGSAGENVAGDWPVNVSDVVKLGWRRSCAHFYNMINGNWRQLGSGWAKDRYGRLWASVHFLGDKGYCSGCPKGCSFCCACANCSSWKSSDPRRP